MKTIRIQISDNSSLSDSVAELDRQISKFSKDSPEFNLLYEQTVRVIEEFISRVESLAKSGTTIHIRKEIDFSDFSVLISLNYPKKNDLFDRIKRIFGGDK